MSLLFFFFFSSRRRHTRWNCDWSSDVCSSDLGGGVWRTTDAGNTWQPLMQHECAAAIGALAVAPSNPSILYVGTGQEGARYDLMPGDGVYRSDDGGEHWKHVGLEATRHIGAILVDPGDPDRVLVAALG